ncbi:MAG: Coenzyme F420 hydrogenase/dehydrogenase, beta subunit C-terminal domain [Pseudomonadota bacterium]
MPHIDIKRPEDCCGCGVCMAVCPNDCIQMLADTEGFLYPQLDSTRCEDCGLCITTCPLCAVCDVEYRIDPPLVYASWHLDKDVRHESSSGGVFTALAEDIIKHGGAVVGAAFDESMVVRHLLIEDYDSLSFLRGSKYVQSIITPELYQQIQSLANEGRYVLFSGTPCQVAALRNYLGREYENIFCCDILCHGVPSPAWFKKYLMSLQKGASQVIQLAFRHKLKGWKQFKIMKTWRDGSTCFDEMHVDPYMSSFLKNYCLRKTCYVCKFTETIRQGDITIADYWGVANKYPQYDRDDKGTSLLLINTIKGQGWLKLSEDRLFLGKGDIETAVAGNPVLSRSARKPPERDTFLQDMVSTSVADLRSKYRLYPNPRKPFWRRALGFIWRRLKKGILS